MKDQDRTTQYDEGSLTLTGTVMLGTGVMIGAGIFALTGQMAEMTGALFPLAFLAAAVIVSFSAYSYIKISNAYPSAGGIGMYLHKAYGDRLPTAFNALLMYFSMVIAQSFLARTFGSYTMQLFGGDESGRMVPILGVVLIISAFIVNLLGNRLIQGVAGLIGILKIGGILIFGVVGVWLADSLAVDFNRVGETGTMANFLGATALGILAFKGFTTITNSGSEVIDPHKNVGRAIIISIAACVLIYTLVGFAVASNLSLAEIIETRDYSLAAAARPALGEYGVWFTVAIAITATAGGILASIFAVSRMLAMLTEMKLVPHRHFGMPGSIQKHTLVYTVVLGLILTAFFDLSRIAALGIIFYLVMDCAIHWGVIRYLKDDINAKGWIPVVAIVLDLLALVGFCWVKLNSDPFVLVVALITMVLIALGEVWFLRSATRKQEQHESHSHEHHHS
ncbi:APC family permease [Ketobacter alkanivorans]|jgi:amino acid transporter|uniref:Amino acid permease n=1 Tax=Ketobacter alkanivorans TaxID=1917421 RepID=A0A2K9LFU3_9GAMM|nr:APC family permease [Ketobacter alkanivorans]MAR91841.1 amino acid permease [Pseudomonadales bacterium]HAG95945.1 APC family permease [Gammaproteobacteria bacterium]AUM11097.1 amino acid permease [Ketobacter alkanivorans]MAR93417.1 amino acid permease [Pseudomonadales bacterium]HBO94075.1 APC family permease [Gammaproteobacteria bacterium]|tara:strand:+ start:36212 stop:37564 length:1353 start_codon:yes stop_codon:yes gene_type:complete